MIFIAFYGQLNCSITVPANFSSIWIEKLTKDLNQWRLKDRISEESKYVIYNHTLNTLLKAPFDVVTAFPDDANLMFTSTHSLESLHTSSCSSPSAKSTTSSSLSNLSQPEPVETISVVKQPELKI